MAASTPLLRISMAPNQISSLICDSDPEIQEVGLRNVTEMATADEGMAFLKALKLVPHITKLMDSSSDKVKLLANWSVANMTSKDDDARKAFVEAGVTEKLNSVIATSQGQVLEKALASLTNLAQSEAGRVVLSTSGVFEAVLKRVGATTEPKSVSLCLGPLVSILKSSNVSVHESFVQSGGIAVLRKLITKLAGNMSGALKSADYELLRTLLAIFFFNSASGSSVVRGEIMKTGFLGVCCAISSLILPPDVGTQSILLQLMVNLSCEDSIEIPILESGFLLVAVDYLGSVSDELVGRSTMLLANMTVNPRVRASIKQFGWDSFLLSLIKHISPEIQRHALRFIINASANDTCRKLIVDAGVLSHLDVVSQRISSGSSLSQLIQLALANLRVPIDDTVKEEFKVETAEVEVETTESEVPRPQTPNLGGVSFTSVEIQDPFQQLDMELQSFFGPDTTKATETQNAPELSAPLISVRGRTATMTKDPKDEPLYIRREKIAREVFDTEEKYVSSLKILVDVFVVPLNQAIAEHKPILTAEEMSTIFSVVQLIYNLHLSFLNKLRPIFEKWTWSSCIGAQFETLADRLKVYETFVNNYDRALALLDSPALQKRKVFQQFMKDAASKAVGVGYAGLSHYMIMPIQRPPRFLMLLGELVKYTPPHHVDMPALKRSVQKMSALASYLNEARRISESQAKVDEITARFGGPLIFEGEQFDIALPGRVFLREGSLLEDRSHLPKSSRDTIQLSKRDSWQLLGDHGGGAGGSGGSGGSSDHIGGNSLLSSSPSSSNLMSSSSGSIGSSSAISGSASAILNSGLLSSSPSLSSGAPSSSFPDSIGKSVSYANLKVKRTPRYVFLFLFNDNLLIASMQKKILQRQSVMHSKLTLINVLPLSRVAALDTNPEPSSSKKEANLKLALKLKDEAFPIVFVADSELEKGEWIASLNTALKATQARQDQDTQISELDRLIDLL
jgi:hypothetical protein